MRRQRGERTTLLGIPIDPIGMDETVARIGRAVDEGRPIAHLGVNAANFVLAHDDPAYRADLERAELVTADGQSVVWGARLYGIDVPERVTGIDLMEVLVTASVHRGWSVYLLGAREEVVESVAQRMEAAGVRVAGRHHGYFREEESTDVAAEIRDTGATLLFVGMTTPRKEHFVIHQALPAGIPFSMGVGGSFDVLAGELSRAPMFVQRLGLEWLFRLVQEPRRLFARYLVTNTRFLLMLLGGALRRRPRGRRR